MFKKRNLIFLSLLLVVFLFTSCLSFLTKPPVTEGILKGKIIVPEGIIKAKDLTGQALPNATINIIDPLTGAILATTTTDANGNYQVLVPAGGPYLLQAIKDGIKVQQITPSVEVGIEYDLGTADCSTTAVALIVQAMLEDDSYPDDPADINLANIEADWYFTGVLNSVCDVLGTGVDPAVSALVQQAVEDFLHPPTPTPHPTPTVPVAAPVIATVSKIADKEENPTVIVTGTNFKYPGGVAADLTVKVTLGERKKTPAALELGTVTFVSTTEITVAFTGRAAAGDVITIQANASAFDPAGVSASNTLTITVPASSDATLKATSTVKGETLLGLGTPNAVIGSATGGTVTITAAKAADTTNLTTFITLFDPTDAGATVNVKVVKYANGVVDFSGFDTATAYANEAITNLDFFIIKVTAADTTTILYYKVVVTVILVVGDSYGGGKVAYIFQDNGTEPDDPGFISGEIHGLIAATADSSETIVWSNITGTEIGVTAQGTAIGTGQTNTTAIVGQNAVGVLCTSGAAHYCDNLIEGGYSDWFLPSKDELNKLYINKIAIGGFADLLYWSSSESNFNTAWYQGFDSGLPNGYFKGDQVRVRAVRAF